MAAFFLVLFLLPGAVTGRPIPDDISIQAFARPSGDKLQLLIRVPFTAFNGIQFPLRGVESYLDLARIGSILPGAARYWIADSIEVYENGVLLPKPQVVQTRAAAPSDKSFESYDGALAHLNGPALPADTDLFWNQAWLDVLFEYPIHSEASAFSIRPKFAHLAARVTTNFKFLPPGGAVRPFAFEGDPGLIKLDPQWNTVAAQFLAWGFADLFNGTDYLLFLFCLVLPFRSFRAAISLGCAFAVAHSVTFIASALNQAPDGLWFPPLVETSIAVTILYVALENIAGSVTLYRRAVVALMFGLLYGFSFAFGLASKVQYAGTHPLISALSFNAGLELGLIVLLALMVPVLNLLLRRAATQRVEIIVLSVLSGHTAWHWMTERADRLNRFRFHWPELDAALLSAAMRWLMIIVILAGLFWFISGLLNQKSDKTSPGPVA